MSLIRITQSDEVKARHVVLFALVVLALAGNCWLTSAAKPSVLPDGARQWSDDSLLLAVVELLDLNYAHPTPQGVAIKALVHGLATAVGLLVVAVALIFQRGGSAADADTDTVIDIEALAAGTSELPTTKKHIDPIVAAQILMAAYIGLCFASSFWSHARDFSFYGALLLTLQAGWAYALGWGLNRRIAVYVAKVLLGVLLVTAALAIWYFGERNPTRRASYPIGNPTFLGACMMAGVTMAVAFAGWGVETVRDRRVFKGTARILVAIIALLVIGRAMQLTQSRGPMVGLLAGLLGIVFFHLRRRGRIWIAVIGAATLLATGGWFYSQRWAPSATGRSASMRLRLYSWDYALELIRQRPLLGHGQGGYTLLADPMAVADVEDDPVALEARVSHAHCEWLEVCTETGSIGGVLLASSLILTLYGGALGVARMRTLSSRWVLIAALGGLTAVLVSESLGTGLRVEGLPLIYYTLIGLVWALARTDADVMERLDGARGWIVRSLLVVLAVGCVVLAWHARRDFVAARASFDLTEAQNRSDWEESKTLATRAANLRLNPQRRYVALRQLAAVHLQIADAYRSRSFQRLARAKQVDKVDPVLASLAVKDRRTAESEVLAGQKVLDRLAQVAPGDAYSGWIQSGFAGVVGDFAAADGDDAAATRWRRVSADALAFQLARRPFEPMLALAYVDAAADKLDAKMKLDLLARPLRMSLAPGALAGAIGAWQAAEDLTALFATIDQEAAAAATMPDDSTWPDRWLPEELRLVAMAQVARGEFTSAVEILKSAAGLYPRLRMAATLAEASCYSELGEALFMSDPREPQPAIDAAATALKTLPPSAPGRRLRDVLRDRLILYHLAADHEDFVKTRLIPELLSTKDETLLKEKLSAEYVALGYSVFSRMLRDDPARLHRWSERAIELAGETDPVWFLAGDIAVHEHDEDRTIECIRNAAKFGGGIENLLAILDRAATALPDSERLQQMRSSLIQQVQQPQQPPAAKATTSAPSSPQD